MDGHPATLTFGAPQGTDVRPICREDLAGTGQPLSYQAVANYIAKYTTKTLSVPGLPSLRIRRETDIGQLRCPTHYRQMITTAWHAGPRLPGLGPHARLRRPLPDQIPPLLRHLRPAPHRPRRPPPHQPAPTADRDAWNRPLDETVVLVLPTTWTYAGIGHAVITPGAELALASADMARAHSSGQ